MCLARLQTPLGGESDSGSDGTVRACMPARLRVCLRSRMRVSTCARARAHAWVYTRTPSTGLTRRVAARAPTHVALHQPCVASRRAATRLDDEQLAALHLPAVHVGRVLWAVLRVQHHRCNRRAAAGRHPSLTHARLPARTDRPPARPTNARRRPGAARRARARRSSSGSRRRKSAGSPRRTAGPTSSSPCSAARSRTGWACAAPACSSRRSSRRARRSSRWPSSSTSRRAVRVRKTYERVRVDACVDASVGTCIDSVCIDMCMNTCVGRTCSAMLGPAPSGWSACGLIGSAPPLRSRCRRCAAAAAAAQSPRRSRWHSRRPRRGQCPSTGAGRYALMLAGQAVVGIGGESLGVARACASSSCQAHRNVRASPTARLPRGYRCAGTQNDRLGESFPTVRSTCPYRHGLHSYGPV